VTLIGGERITAVAVSLDKMNNSLAKAKNEETTIYKNHVTRPNHGPPEKPDRLRCFNSMSFCARYVKTPI